jgi:RHS repeat-associated protein
MPDASVGGISSNGFNLPFDNGLDYDSSNAGTSNGFGNGWLPGSLAGLGGTVPGGGPSTGPVSYTPAPDRTLTFLPDSAPGTYKAAYFVKDQLSFNSGTGHYNLLKAGGSIKEFDSDGLLLATKNPGGDQAVYNYDGSGKLSSVVMTVGGVTVSYSYTWSAGLVSEIVYTVAGRAVLKTTYGYSGALLERVKTWENSTAGTGTPDWGTSPISSTRFSYHSTSGLLRHVVPPTQYRQMALNGIDPDTATMAQLDDYAASEYEYGAYNRVSVLRTHGRRYTYTFTYTASTTGGGGFNTWWARTDVVQPDASRRIYYFNRGGQLMLERVSDSATSPTKTWNVVAQQFDNTLARLLKTADASAIASVNESDPALVTLNTSAGRIEVISYDASGYPGAVSLQQGSAGTLHKQREWTYTGRTLTGLGTIYKPASEIIYRNEGNTGAITTSFAYLWHGTTAQISRRTTTLPVVSSSENGRGITYTRVSDFDNGGYLTSSTDERGTVTTYQYDKARGGMTQRTADAGSGKLNLQTDNTLDDRGRAVRVLGPAHDAILPDGTSASIRTATWTYYKDREGSRVSFRGYVKVSGGTEHAIGPVTVMEPNLAPPSGYSGWRMASSYDAKWTAGSIPTPSTTYAQTDWVRWSLSLTDQKSELKEQWNYFLIPASGQGAQSTNYGKKLFAYDSAGRQNQTTCAGGTVDKTTYNAMGWAAQEELGTSAGLTVTRVNQHDDDGNLTKVTLPVDGISGNDRVTDYRYDWRNRQSESETTVQKDGGTTTLIQKQEYDNRNLVVASTGYKTSVASGNTISRQTTDYDVLGRQYRTSVYAVNSSGTAYNPQVSNVYYEAGGQVARSAPSGSALFTASTFDAVGRTLKSFQAYEPSGFTPGSDPSSMASAIVMEQQAMAWDAAGNLLSTTSRARFDDTSTSATGELGTPSTSPQARVSYAASYSDAIGRGIATASYGTNGASAWTRPATVPARADDVLVNTTEYDSAGNATKSIDPASMETVRAYDSADRLVTQTDNAAGSGSAVRVTRYEYTDDGWLKKLKCENSSTGQQVTEWVYGVGPVTSPASALYSNRLVLKKIYPGGGTDEVTYAYNRQLQVTGMTDQNGSVHAYDYDKLARLLADTVTTVGSGVDAAVRRLESGYDDRGRLSRSTSYSDTAGTTKVNEVLNAYNDFNQLTTDYQEHSGAVNTGTSLKVQYSFADGSANTVRPTGITYPNGAVVGTAYTSAQASFLSRPDQVTDVASSTTVVASMRYLGLGTLVGLNYDGASNLNLTYQNGGTGTAGDKYTGLDRFGRIVETIWIKGTGDVVQGVYGRNRSSGIDWRRDDEASSTIAMDAYYEYDGLQQVTVWKRGNLSPSGGPPYTGVTSQKQGEDFTYDQTGNWLGDVSDNPNFTQSRTHDVKNQITSITGPTGVIQPDYDNAGNMTLAPSPGSWTTGYTYKWDAWNRLVEIKQGTTVVGAYAYDALTRRTRKTVGGVTRDIYYDRQWRSVEERESNTVKVQHTWSPLDRWTLIRRKRNASGSTLNETLFCLRDYLDPVALANTSGVVVERYNYDAFGTVRIMNAAFGVLGNSAYEWEFLYHGEFRDKESEFAYYGYRYLDTQLGRWLSRDPIGERGGKNLYAFVENQTIDKLDMYGTMSCGVASSGPVQKVVRADDEFVSGGVKVPNSYRAGTNSKPSVMLVAIFDEIGDCPDSVNVRIEAAAKRYRVANTTVWAHASYTVSIDSDCSLSGELGPAKFYSASTPVALGLKVSINSSRKLIKVRAVASAVLYGADPGPEARGLGYYVWGGGFDSNGQDIGPRDQATGGLAWDERGDGVRNETVLLIYHRCKLCAKK